MTYLWDFLNGRKTFIGLAAGAAYLFLVSINLIDRNPATEDTILGWLGFSLFHKVLKG